jgi:hypothetical protein
MYLFYFAFCMLFSRMSIEAEVACVMVRQSGMAWAEDSETRQITHVCSCGRVNFLYFDPALNFCIWFRIKSVFKVWYEMAVEVLSSCPFLAEIRPSHLEFETTQCKLHSSFFRLYIMIFNCLNKKYPEKTALSKNVIFRSQALSPPAFSNNS